MDTTFDIDPNLVNELAKSIKSEKDLAALSKHLLKLTVERAMNVEMDEHLGYEKHAPEGKHSSNNRNGHSQKTLKGNFGEVEIRTLRDRNATFEPQLIRKSQTRITELDSQILSLYAKGMTTRDIASTFKEMYGTDISHTLISKVTDSVLDEVHTWQNRPLDSIYPILYLDCIVIKCHHVCIVHMVRNSLRYVPYKDMKAVAGDLKSIYHSVNAEAAELALNEFSSIWDEKYPSISLILPRFNRHTYTAIFP